MLCNVTSVNVMQQNTGISRHVFKVKTIAVWKWQTHETRFHRSTVIFFIWIDSLVVHGQTSAEPAVCVLLDSVPVWREICNVSSPCSAQYEFTALDWSTVPYSAILPCDSAHVCVCTSWFRDYWEFDMWSMEYWS